MENKEIYFEQKTGEIYLCDVLKEGNEIVRANKELITKDVAGAMVCMLLFNEGNGNLVQLDNGEYRATLKVEIEEI